MGCGASAPQQARQPPACLTVERVLAAAELVDFAPALAEAAETAGVGEETPLHKAAEAGAVESIKALLEASADKEARDEYGQTPLHLAVMGGSDLSIRFGADSLVASSSLESIKALIDAGADKEAKTAGRYANTPLHLAAGKGAVDSVKLLLDAGAKKDVKNFDGDTPLSRAAKACVPVEVIKALLEAGANHGVKDNQQQYTPLHHAARFRPTNAETIAALVAAKANINAKDYKGKTPLALARINQTQEAIEALERLGART